jgi:glucarate dehydratase
MPLRIDPNAAWTVETSLRWAKELEGLLEYYEDPTGGQVGMAEVAKQTSLPLATNMCTVSFNDLPESIRLGSVKITLGDHHFWGGLRASVELARICRTWGIGMSMHSNSHMGISLAAMTHLAAAVPNLTYACDTHYPWQDDGDEVIQGGKIPIRDGCVSITDAAGLGVDLDHEKLRKLHESFLSCGIRQRDDVRQMRRYRPDWKTVKPRF